MYEPQVKSQVDHGAEPWSEAPLLNGALPTVNQYGNSPPPSVVPCQTASQQERNLLGHYSPRLAVDVTTHC